MIILGDLHTMTALITGRKRLKTLSRLRGDRGNKWLVSLLHKVVPPSKFVSRSNHTDPQGTLAMSGHFGFELTDLGVSSCIQITQKDVITKCEKT